MNIKEVLRKLVREELLKETRPTNLLGYIKSLTSIPTVNKVIKTKYVSNGISAIVSDKSGNAYEFTIKPAAYADNDWGSLLKKK